MTYTPNEWSVGDLITASKMNKIERQLVENTSDLDDIRNGATVPTSEEFEEVSNQLFNLNTYNCINLLQTMQPEDIVEDNIRITFNKDGSCFLERPGTTTEKTYAVYYDSSNSLPDFMKKETEYLLEINGLDTDIKGQIYCYTNGILNNTPLVETNTSAFFTIPNTASGVLIQIEFPARAPSDLEILDNDSFETIIYHTGKNIILYPKILNGMTNAQIKKELFNYNNILKNNSDSFNSDRVSDAGTYTIIWYKERKLCTINGSGLVNDSIINKNLSASSELNAGETYYLFFTTTNNNLFMEIKFIVNNQTITEKMTDEINIFTIPENTTALQLNIRTNDTQTFSNEQVRIDLTKRNGLTDKWIKQLANNFKNTLHINESQSLTTVQKDQARNNIGAASEEDVALLKSAVTESNEFAMTQIGLPGVNIADISGYQLRNGALGSTGNWSNINNNYKNIAVPVPATGCRLRIKVAAGSPNLIFAGVTKLTDPVNGQSYYADSTLGRRSLSASSGLTGYDIPNDVKYIVLNTKWNANDVVIESFSITKPQSNGKIQNDIYDLRNVRPMLSIIDDDGQRESWNNWEEICDELGITASFALITGSVGAANYITWSDVDRLTGKGYGMLSHTDGHIHMASTSDEDMEQDFIATTAALRQHGVRDMYLVYPYGERPTSMTLVKKYFQCGVMTGVDNVNQPPIDRWNIYRCSAVQTGDDNKINVEYEGQTYSVPRFKTFEEFKAVIDNAIEHRAFLVLMTHLRNYPPTGYYYDNAAKVILEQALTYAAENGVEIVPFSEGYKRFVNRFESPNVTIDCNGNVLEN